MINPVNQGNMNVSYTPTGNTMRSLGAGLFNAENIAREDFARAEQAQDNQFARDLYFMQEQARINAKEAEKQRAYDKEMSSTEISRRMEDLKRSGLNPVLALQQGGANYSGGSSGSTSSARSSTGNTGYKGESSNVVSMLLSIAAGLLTA